MKYIAYYGGLGTCLLGLFQALMMVIIFACNVHTQYEVVYATLSCIYLTLSLFVAIVCAWIVCDMRKRMKDL